MIEINCSYKKRNNRKQKLPDTIASKVNSSTQWTQILKNLPTNQI